MDVPSLLPRAVQPNLVEALGDTRVVMIAGPRQAGKSTLAATTTAGEGRIQVTLDDATTRRNAIADPSGFIAGFKGPVLIDEIQRAPELVLAIKATVDVDQRPGRFLLTGSANFLTAPRIRESLAGRIQIVRLLPLAQSEIERSTHNVVDRLFAADPPRPVVDAIGREAFVDRVARGGFPSVRMRSERRRYEWFDSYVDASLVRDIEDLDDVRRLDELPRLLRVVAAQATGMLNASNLSRSVDMDYRTVQSYIQLLETVYVIRRSLAWRSGLGAREVSTPKVYVVDTALLAYLLNADEDRIANDDQVTGKIYENFVAMETAKHIEWAEHIGIRQYHWRDGRDEVDIILEKRSGEIVAIEAKSGATVDPRDARPMAKLRDRIGPRFVAGAVVYTGQHTVPLGDRLWAVPVSGLWEG